MSLQSAVSTSRGFVPPPAVSNMPWAVSPASDGRTGAGLAQNGTALHFQCDSEIYAEGDEAKSFYKVISGVVRTCRFMNDGRRQIEAFHVAGDVFGLEANADRRLSAEAVSDCTIMPYRRLGLEKLTANDSALAQQLFSYAMQYVERARDHAMLLGRCSAAEKVAAFLLEIAHRSPHGEIIELPMSRQDIADYLGLTIETVCRLLSALKREGAIGIPNSHQVELHDRAALEAIAEA